MSDKKHRSDNEIRKLARDCVDGLIYGTWYGDDSTDAFPQLQEGSPVVERLKTEGIMHVYQYVALALPEKVNGQYRFTSFETLDQYDAARLDQAIHRITRHKTG
jgi:hypothetical protein